MPERAGLWFLFSYNDATIDNIMAYCYASVIWQFTPTQPVSLPGVFLVIALIHRFTRFMKGKSKHFGVNLLLTSK